MTTAEILQQLERLGPEPPRQALQAAVAQKDAIIPELIAALDRVTAQAGEFLKDEGYMLPIYALYLLAEFREPRAFRPILWFFSLPGEQALDLTGDLITEDGSQILASVCGGDVAPLLKLACDESINEFVRYEAIQALAVLVAWGEKPRDEVVDLCCQLFEGGLSKPGHSFVWAALVSAALHLNAQELLPQIRRAYDEGLVQETFVGWRDDVEKDFAERGGAMFRDFAERHRPITNTPSYFDGWACFEEQRERLARKSTKAPLDPCPPRASVQPEPMPYVPPPKPTPCVPPPRPTPYIAPPKVGRNDLCPCGSGKKYKKCCGKN